MSITIIPYDTNWPVLFAQEAETLYAIFGDLVVDIHHIGSTAIPGMQAKPVIDMLPVVKDITQVENYTQQMKAAGCMPKGEYGIPFRCYFQKENAGIRTHNIHIYESGNPEIARHIAFRDYMRSHSEEAQAYGALKQQLAAIFPDDMMAYCNGKDDFICDIDHKAGCSDVRIMQACTKREWEHYHRIVKEAIFDRTNIAYDPNHPTLCDPHYTHFVLLKGMIIIGVVVIEFLGKSDAILRIIAIDADYRNQSLGTGAIPIIECWLQHQGKHRIFLHANPKAVSFYQRHGYKHMPFPNGDVSMFSDAVDMGKFIK